MKVIKDETLSDVFNSTPEEIRFLREKTKEIALKLFIKRQRSREFETILRSEIYTACVDFFVNEEFPRIDLVPLAVYLLVDELHDVENFNKFEGEASNLLKALGKEVSKTTFAYCVEMSTVLKEVIKRNE